MVLISWISLYLTSIFCCFLIYLSNMYCFPRIHPCFWLKQGPSFIPFSPFIWTKGWKGDALSCCQCALPGCPPPNRIILYLSVPSLMQPSALSSPPGTLKYITLQWGVFWDGEVDLQVKTGVVQKVRWERQPIDSESDMSVNIQYLKPHIQSRDGVFSLIELSAPEAELENPNRTHSGLLAHV